MTERRILVVCIFVFIIGLGGCASRGPCSHELIQDDWRVMNYAVPEQIIDNYKIGFLLTSRFDTISQIYNFEPSFEIVPKYRVGSNKPISQDRIIIDSVILSNKSMHLHLKLAIDSIFKVTKNVYTYPIDLEKVVMDSFKLISKPISLNLSYITTVINSTNGKTPIRREYHTTIFPYLQGLEYQWATNESLANPFCSTTNILYDLATSGPVMVVIYNIEGQVVDTLVNETQEVGEHSMYWDTLDMNGRPAPSGIYFYKISTPDKSEAHKMVLMR